METHDLVLVERICSSYHVEADFIDALLDSGLIEIVTVDEKKFIDQAQVRDLEQMIRLHADLDINLEGIETIRHLLQRMEVLQREMTEIKNRLRFYENS